MFLTRQRVTFLTVLLLISFFVFGLPSVSAEETVNIYRLFNPVTGEHLYTPDAEEVKTLVGTCSGYNSIDGWNSEGTGWEAPSAGKPVYRVYNAVLGEHLYTVDTDEVRNLTTRNGWISDFGGKPIFYSGGDIPVYRLYDEKTGRHHLTTSAVENRILPADGWKQEGIAFYGAKEGSALIGPSDITNTDSISTIQTDVTLTGSGAGYHAKILAQTPSSAVSFGLQFDTGGVGVYQNNTGIIIENIYNNAPGQQRYYRPGLVTPNQTYRLMLTVQGDGTCRFYVNGVELAQKVSNPGLVGQRVDLSVEGSGKQNGDQLEANFTNILIKNNAVYKPDKQWRAIVRDTNPYIHSDISRYKTDKTVKISGAIKGLNASQDWDNSYDVVSGVTTFYE